MKRATYHVNIRSPGEPYLIQQPQGYFEYQLPISVKGILLDGSDVLLVGNPRGEFELPGGKLEVGETPSGCVVREVEEETALKVAASRPVHSWVYEITSKRHVFLIAYGITVAEGDVRRAIVSASPEVGHATWFSLASLDCIDMPEDYRTAIRAWETIRMRSI